MRSTKNQRRAVKTNIVLDIDGVLACKSVETIEQANFFKNKGAILTAIKTHYIFPGVIEFIKLLFQTENVKVSFFSSGDKKRNVIFVDQLLKLALSEAKYNETKSKVCILSRDDLTEPTNEERKKQRVLYDLRPGNMQKDISKALGEGDFLENAVLIDDDRSYVACGQAKNILFVPESKNRNFERLSSKCDSYQTDGYKFLRCVIATKKSSSPEKRAVKEGKQILLLKTEEGFKVGFLNKSGKYQALVISHEKHESLLLKLNEIHQSNSEKNKSASIIEDNELVKDICELVGSFEGKARKICRQANRICYVTGLLFKALKVAESKNISISDSLFQIQFKFKEGEKTYEPDFKQSCRMEELYLIGLEKLKEVNSGLQFITPHNYLECVQLLMSEEEQLTLQEAIKNQDNGCCIM